MPENQLVLYKNNPLHGPRNSVSSLLGRVLGASVDLRKGGLLPEELPKDQAERLMALLKSRLQKKVDAVTGEVSFELARAGVVTATAGQPCLANLCRQAHTILADAVRALSSIRPLDPSGDPELVEAAKAILESEFKALMHELCLHQPRFLQIKSLLDNAEANVQALESHISSEGGPTRVNSVDEDSVVISLRVLHDYVRSLKTSFENFKEEHFSLSCLLEEITFALETIVETVAQARMQLYEDGVTEADLRVIRLLPLPSVDYREERLVAHSLSADAFLSLNEYEAQRMVQVVERAGKIGVKSIEHYANAIVEQFRTLLGPPQNYKFLQHLTATETFNLLKAARSKGGGKEDIELFKLLEGFRSTAQPTVFEFIKRHPYTLFFLFKLQLEWEEVLEFIDKVGEVTHRVATAQKSDQGPM